MFSVVCDLVLSPTVEDNISAPTPSILLLFISVLLVSVLLVSALSVSVLSVSVLSVSELGVVT